MTYSTRLRPSPKRCASTLTETGAVFILILSRTKYQKHKEEYIFQPYTSERQNTTLSQQSAMLSPITQSFTSPSSQMLYVELVRLQIHLLHLCWLHSSASLDQNVLKSECTTHLTSPVSVRSTFPSASTKVGASSI